MHVSIRQLGRPQRHYIVHHIHGQETRGYMWGADPKKRGDWSGFFFFYMESLSCSIGSSGMLEETERETHVSEELQDV